MTPTNEPTRKPPRVRANKPATDDKGRSKWFLFHRFNPALIKQGRFDIEGFVRDTMAAELPATDVEVKVWRVVRDGARVDEDEFNAKMVLLWFMGWARSMPRVKR